MSLATVLSAITWPNVTGGGLTPIAANDPVRAKVINAITNLYNGSTVNAAAILEAAAARGDLNFLNSSVGSLRATYGGLSLIGLDSNQISDLRYFNDKGVIVSEIFEITLIHEIIHTDGSGDPLPPGTRFTQVHINSSIDFNGDTVNKQNAVSGEMGYTNNIQASYYSTMSPSDVLWSRFDHGISYSAGAQVKFALWDVVGYDGNNVYDLSGRTDHTNDILFGFDGSDTLNGGGGNDYLYGGELDDKFLAASGSDFFHGGGTRRVDGTALIIEYDGNDEADYSASVSDQSIRITTDVAKDSVHANAMDNNRRILVLKETVSGGMITQSGADTLVSIEKIAGTNGADTLEITTLASIILAGPDGKGGLAQVDLKSESASTAMGDTIDMSKLTEAAKVDLRTTATSAFGIGGYVAAVADGNRGLLVTDAERVIGTAFDDDITGDDEANQLLGGGGADRLVGAGGDDEIWGGEGLDTADYSGQTSAIAIEFDGTITGGVVSVKGGVSGTDTLHSIERIIGTAGRDVVNIVGQIATGTNLTIDGGGGQGDNPAATINFSKSTVGGTVNLAGGVGSISTGANQTINLVGFNTEIIGSSFNDSITDNGAGHKNIDGGAGNDVISISGTAGAGMLLGGLGDDVLIGGAGNDVLNGGVGSDDLSGGGGSDLLISRDRVEALSTEVLDGGEGSDKLVVTGNVDGEVILRGGGGNDLLHSTASSSSGSGGVVVEFGIGAGNDEIIGNPVASSIQSPGGIAWNVKIDASSLSRDDVKIVWTPNVISQNGDVYEIQGDLALVIKGTGESILFRNVSGFRRLAAGTLVTDPVTWDNYTSGSIWGIQLPDIVFSDGDEILADGISFVDFDMSGAASYDQAAAAYAAAIALPAGSQNGGDGADELSGTAGDDTLSGGGGDDNFDGSAGNDAIDGGAGNDTLNLFGARSDYEVTEDGLGGHVVTDLRGGAVTAITNVENIYFIYDNEAAAVEGLFPIFGTAGDDNPLNGSPFDDQIAGLAGDDVIIAGGGNDRVTGGVGDDTIVEGAGDDTYFWNLGDGDDLITGGGASDGSDTLEFGAGITADSLRYGGTLDGWGLKVWIEGQAGSITIDRMLDSGNRQIDQFRFADGSLLSRSQILAEAFVQIPTAGDDHIFGSQGDDMIGALDGDDIIDARGGDDVIVGGEGSDLIKGGEGYDQAYYLGASSDFRISRAPDGSVEVWDLLGNEGHDVLSGVEALYFDDDDTTILVSSLPPLGTVGDDTIVGTAGSETLYGFEGNDRLEGSGGADTLLGGWGADVLLGQTGDDVLIGGNGDDILTGGAGDDVYRVSLGEGADVIDEYGNGSGGSGGTDTLVLGAGITPDDVTVTQQTNGTSFVLEFAGMGDSITLHNSLQYSTWRIELVRFDDGTTWSHADLLSKSMESNDGDDIFYGDENSQTISGGLGNDQLIGWAGNDVLIGGAGSDLLMGGGGNDSYIFSLGDGQDVIEDGRGPVNFNTLQFTAEISPEDVIVGTDSSGFDVVIGFSNSDDTVTLRYMNIANNGVSQILFADGTIWSVADILGRAAGGGSMAQAATALGWAEVQMQSPDFNTQTVGVITDADRLAEAAGSFGSQLASARAFSFDGFEARLWGGQPEVVYVSRCSNGGSVNFDTVRH